MRLNGFAQDIKENTTPEQIVLVELLDSSLFAGNICNITNNTLEVQQYYSNGKPASKVMVHLSLIRCITKDSKTLQDLAQLIDDARQEDILQLEKSLQIDIEQTKKRASHGDNIRASENELKYTFGDIPKR